MIAGPDGGPALLIRIMEKLKACIRREPDQSLGGWLRLQIHAVRRLLQQVFDNLGFLVLPADGATDCA